jgi:hypothetical protein
MLAPMTIASYDFGSTEGLTSGTTSRAPTTLQQAGLGRLAIFFDRP